MTGALDRIGRYDEWLARRIRRRPLPPLALRAAWLVSGLNGPVCVLISFFTAVTGRWRLLLALALALGLGCTALVQLKTRLPRLRPCDGVLEPHAPPPVLYFAADHGSFPSGHAVVASALTTVLLLGWPALGLALLPFLALVTASRLVLGHHYPSDMVGGLLVGSAAAAAMARLAF